MTLAPLLPTLAGMSPGAAVRLRAVVGMFGSMRAAQANPHPTLVPLDANAPGTLLFTQYPPDALARAMITGVAAAALYSRVRPTEVALLADSYMSETKINGRDLATAVEDVTEVAPSQDPEATECLMVTYAAHGGDAWLLALPYGYDDAGRFSWRRVRPWVASASPLGAAVSLAVGSHGDPPDGLDDPQGLAALGILVPW